MEIEYELLFKSGAKETLTQVAEEAQHIEIIQIVQDSFKEGLNSVITFGDGTGEGRYIRVSDLSQMKTTIINRDAL